MKHELRLTDIGEGLEEAEIIAWLVAVGDEVGRDQPIVEIMTDKSNAELPAPVTGRVVEVSGAVGDMVNVGDLIAIIESSADEPAATVPAAPGSPASGAPASGPPTSVDTRGPIAEATREPPTAQTRRPKASPSTRRAAAERGIDLSEVRGSGPGGRILLSDLDSPAGAQPTPAPISQTQTVANDPIPSRPARPAAERPAPTVSAPEVPAPAAAPPAAVEPLRGIRRAVALNMTQSWAEIPHIHAFQHVDAQELLDMRARLKATGKPGYERLTALSFFVAAVARALRTHRRANASIDMAAQTITNHADINVGVAVAAPQGLVVPVLRRADEFDFEALSVALGELVVGAREGTLNRDHYVGGTITITNFGSLGGEQAVPLIRPPESMIVGFGSIADRPFVVDGAVVARKTMHIVAGADHRLLDGDTTTAVLSDIAASLTDPLRLVV